MRLLHLPTVWTIVLDALAWLILQPAISWLVTQLPVTAFDPDAWLYRARRWERQGEAYQALLAVRRWKEALPSGGAWLGGFRMQRITSSQPGYLRRWLLETCRAELAHWLQILVAPLFFLWNPPLAGGIIIFYALAANLPCIVVQRYNRPRLCRVLERAEEQGKTSRTPRCAANGCASESNIAHSLELGPVP